MDGQRLVMVSGAGYGLNGSEYRTEIDSFARIRLEGDMSSSSSYFTVEQKNGQTSYYGAVDGTQGEAVFVPSFEPGKTPAPLSWSLRRVEDPQTNSIIYTYRNLYGDHHLVNITYTGRGTAAGAAGREGPPTPGPATRGSTTGLDFGGAAAWPGPTGLSLTFTPVRDPALSPVRTVST